jgi:hypothetical protein
MVIRSVLAMLAIVLAFLTTPVTSSSTATAPSSSNCTAVAATLSSHFNSTYRPPTQSVANNSLELFLDDHGLLVTMCMRFRGMLPWMECTIPSKSSLNYGWRPSTTKVSASWVHSKKTRGFRVIGRPIDIGPPVGLVLKPTELSVRCLYPADAATDGRDGDGCGVPSSDPQFGSQGYDHTNWINKIMTKYQIMQYKNDAFGKDRHWNTIPCSEFLGPPYTPGNDTSNNINLQVLGRLEDNQQWEIYDIPHLIIEQWSYIMGFPICNHSSPVPPPDLDDGMQHDMIYYGLDFWRPINWTVSLELMMKLFNDFPTLEIWNELVLDVPTTTTTEMTTTASQLRRLNDNLKNDQGLIGSDFPSNAVQAVFYITGQGIVLDTVSRIVARRVGKRLRKPVLSVEGLSDEAERDKTKDIFKCG